MNRIWLWLQRQLQDRRLIGRWIVIVLVASWFAAQIAQVTRRNRARRCHCVVVVFDRVGAVGCRVVRRVLVGVLARWRWQRSFRIGVAWSRRSNDTFSVRVELSKQRSCGHHWRLLVGIGGAAGVPGVGLFVLVLQQRVRGEVSGVV